MPFFFITRAAFEELRNLISAAAAAGSLARVALDRQARRDLRPAVHGEPRNTPSLKNTR
jgi:hypothetical protein